MHFEWKCHCEGREEGPSRWVFESSLGRRVSMAPVELRIRPQAQVQLLRQQVTRLPVAEQNFEPGPVASQAVPAAQQAAGRFPGQKLDS